MVSGKKFWLRVLWTAICLVKENCSYLLFCCIDFYLPQFSIANKSNLGLTRRYRTLSDPLQKLRPVGCKEWSRNSWGGGSRKEGRSDDPAWRRKDRWFASPSCAQPFRTGRLPRGFLLTACCILGHAFAQAPGSVRGVKREDCCIEAWVKPQPSQLTGSTAFTSCLLSQ